MEKGGYIFMTKKIELQKLCPKFHFVHKNLTQEISMKIKKHSERKKPVSILGGSEDDFSYLKGWELHGGSFDNPQIKQALKFLG